MSYNDQIQMCLNCRKNECDDCLDSKYEQKLVAIENGTSRNNAIECNGECFTMKEWARILDIKYATLTRRIRANVNLMDMVEYQTYMKANRKMIAAY